MQALSKLAHSAAAKAARKQTIRLNHRELTATEAQRSRLRPTSINVSHKRKYDEIANPPAIARPAKSPSKKARVEPLPTSRRAALQGRISKVRPKRFEFHKWKKWKEETIELLQPFYPHSMLPLCPCHGHNSPFP